jgi:hypothetical protein
MKPAGPTNSAARAPKSLARVTSALCVALATASWAGSASAGTSIEFPFRDDALLSHAQKDGGLVYVPDAIHRGESVPLVVFLHGINAYQSVHLWMGSTIGPFDLRADWDNWLGESQVRPALLAAPSQSRMAATAATLWSDFDLEQFVDATEASLGGLATIDRSQVLVVGHSGAGCNKAGGLASIIAAPKTIHPLGIVAIDICMEEDSATALALAPLETPVAIYWQTSWARPFNEFRSAFDVLRGPQAAPHDVVEEVPIVDRDAHNAIVKIALPRALGIFLPPATQRLQSL